MAQENGGMESFADMESFVILGTSPQNSLIESQIIEKFETTPKLERNDTSTPDIVKQMESVVIEEPKENSLEAPENDKVQTTPKSNENSPSLKEALNFTIGNENFLEYEKNAVKSSSQIWSTVQSIADSIILGTLDPSEVSIRDHIQKNTQNVKPKTSLEQQQCFEVLLSTLSRQNLKLRQSYAKMQKYQSDVFEYGNEVAIKERNQENTISKLQDEVHKLRTALAQSQSRVSNPSVDAVLLQLQNENVQLKSQMQDLEAITNERDQHREELRVLHQKARCNMDFLEAENFELKKKVSEKMSVIQNMSAEINKLQTLSRSPSSRKSPAKQDDTQFITFVDHKKAMKELERKQSTLLAEKLELKETKIQLENQILNLEESVECLQLKLANKTKDHTDIFEKTQFLEIQASTYQEDYREERRLREELVREKEMLISECKLLQNRNTILNEELQKKSQNTVAPIPIPQSSASASSNPVESPDGFTFLPNPISHECPICQKRFRALCLLEAHIDQCLT